MCVIGSELNFIWPGIYDALFIHITILSQYVAFPSWYDVGNAKHEIYGEKNSITKKKRKKKYEKKKMNEKNMLCEPYQIYSLIAFRTI